MKIESQNLPSIADRETEVDGQMLAYRDQGNGQVILCLHAVGHSSKDFISLYGLPMNKFRIICLDFPGHGKSGPSSGSISASYFSGITKAFIEKLQLRNIIIIGNSIGGAVAIRIASDNPNIRMLSLSDPAGIDKRGLISKFFLRHMVGFFRKGMEERPRFGLRFARYYEKVLTSDTAKARREEIIKDGYKLSPLLFQAWKSFSSRTEDLRPLIGTIHCPVLFAWGIRDRFVRLGRNMASIRRFTDYELIKYPIGHTPYIECPKIFLKDLQDFIHAHPILVN